jgi:signal peptidase I
LLISSPAHTGWHIAGASMEPTLHCAEPAADCLGRYPDWPVVSPVHGTPPRADIVAFRTPRLAAIRCGAGGVFIQRIIGLPGEKWSEKNGYVYINGNKLNEPYATASRRDLRTITPLTIPPGRYFVMGDNRSSTCDSRVWGTVPRANIIGDVTKVYRKK